MEKRNSPPASINQTKAEHKIRNRQTLSSKSQPFPSPRYFLILLFSESQTIFTVSQTQPQKAPFAFCTIPPQQKGSAFPISKPTKKAIKIQKQADCLMERLFIVLLVASTTASLLFHHSSAGLIAEPVTDPGQPLRPGDSSSSPNTVPAFPVQSSRSEFCHLDLSDELFGGVNDACGHNLDRSRCCPVLAAWLFAAYARSALAISPAPSPSPSPSASADDAELPMMPDDSQRCVDSLQTSLLKRNIKIPQPNATCDAVLCFCGIRLHQITSLSCPAAFNVTPPHRNATPTAAVRNLEKSCRNSSYSGCTKCLGALQKLKGEVKNGTSTSSRASKMFNRDCKLMGLTWLLARNKTAYITTVSAVLRAMLYSPHPHENRCSPDQENMPLAVDSLQFENSASSNPIPSFPVLPLLLAVYYSLFTFTVY